MKVHSTSRWVCTVAAVSLAASLSGCCASPYRMYQNAYGFNCPLPEYFDPTLKPQRTTPAGPISPAAWPSPPEVAP
jgi:hypothetical protein